LVYFFIFVCSFTHNMVSMSKEKNLR